LAYFVSTALKDVGDAPNDGWPALEDVASQTDRGNYLMRSERVAFLKGDPEIDFQHVADALDIAHQAGADRVGLMYADSVSAKDVNAAGLKR
jgi:hypothetical protein